MRRIRFVGDPRQRGGEPDQTWADCCLEAIADGGLDSGRCDARRGLEAVEADEDVDNAHISEREVVADGVELPIEAHRVSARPAARVLRLRHAVRLAADAVSGPDVR
jgi:hypothetical protein